MKDTIRPAIVAVGYDRADSMHRLLSSIGAACFAYDDIPLIISIDRGAHSEDVVKVAQEFQWNYGTKRIIRHSQRQGLRSHILQCGDLSQQYGAVIILEDDIAVSPWFYHYIDHAVPYYYGDEQIAGFALYSHQWNGYAKRFFEPVPHAADCYLGQYSVTWGQCWTDRQWMAFREWYGDGNRVLAANPSVPKEVTGWPETSWGKYFAHYLAEKNRYYLMPYHALATNFSETGQHEKAPDSRHQVALMMGKRDYRFLPSCELLRYDMFFESCDVSRYLGEEIRADGICVDLYGHKCDYGKARYILTTRTLPYERVRSYGLQMRPHELNIQYGIAGCEIILYDRNKKGKITKSARRTVMKYDLKGITLKALACYLILELPHRLRRK